MARIATLPLRIARAGLRKLGLGIVDVPGQERWRVGVEVLWHKPDENIERAAISTVRYGGESLFFLVRNPADWIQGGHHLRGKFYSAEELESIREAYRGGTFIDIGANVGNHSLFAAKVLKAPRVLACEPNPEAYRILRCNIVLNDLSDVVQHLPFGLSDGSGRASLETPDPGINLGGTRLKQGGEGSVELRAGDELFGGEERIGFIKIDVEGLEIQVLEGLRETIGRTRPPMLVEVDDTNREAFHGFCEALGYDIVREDRRYTAMANLLLEPRDLRSASGELSAAAAGAACSDA